jgi:hypothetical protein
MPAPLGSVAFIFGSAMRFSGKAARCIDAGNRRAALLAPGAAA